MQPDPQRPLLGPAGRGERLAVRPELGRHIDRAVRRLPARPDRPDRGDLVYVQGLGWADPHGAGDWLDVEHVARVAIMCRAVDPQATALSDGEAIAALVIADHPAVVIDDRPGRQAQPTAQETPRVTVGYEADVVTVRLVGDGEAAPRGLGPHLLLGAVAERKHRPAQLLAGQHTEHVGLVLGEIHAAREPDWPASRRRLEPGVMAGADGVETERDRPVEYSGELDLLVASQAWVGRVPARILGDEVVDYVGSELFSHIPHVEGDADHVGGAPGVPRVLERATAARAGPV